MKIDSQCDRNNGRFLVGSPLKETTKRLPLHSLLRSKGKCWALKVILSASLPIYLQDTSRQRIRKCSQYYLNGSVY